MLATPWSGPLTIVKLSASPSSSSAGTLAVTGVSSAVLTSKSSPVGARLPSSPLSQAASVRETNSSAPRRMREAGTLHGVARTERDADA